MRFIHVDDVSPATRCGAKELIWQSFSSRPWSTSEGTQGLLAEGGSGRKAVLQKAVQGLGGTIEAITSCTATTMSC